MIKKLSISIAMVAMLVLVASVAAAAGPKPTPRVFFEQNGVQREVSIGDELSRGSRQPDGTCQFARELITIRVELPNNYERSHVGLSRIRSRVVCS